MPHTDDTTNQTQILKTIISHTKMFDCDKAMLAISKGANPNVFSNYNESLLHLLVRGNLDGQYSDQIRDLVKKYHARVDIQPIERPNALNALNAQGTKTPLAMLLEADCNGLSIDHQSVLLLLSLGANPNTKNSQGNTYLQILLKEEASDTCYAHLSELEHYRANWDMPHSLDGDKTLRQVYQEKYSKKASLFNNKDELLEHFRAVMTTSNPSLFRNFWKGRTVTLNDLLSLYSDSSPKKHPWPENKRVAAMAKLSEIGFEFKPRAKDNGESLLRILHINKLRTEYHQNKLTRLPENETFTNAYAATGL